MALQQTKRPRGEPDGTAPPQNAALAPPPAPAAAAPGPDPESDQVFAALKKITSYIANPSKFAKASPLLRNLLEGQALGRAHRAAAFDALAAALPLVPAEAGAHLVDPHNRRWVKGRGGGGRGWVGGDGEEGMVRRGEGVQERM